MQVSSEQPRNEWSILPIEDQAIILFAWSHPEIGHPDKLSFWRLALEMDVWWKFAQSTRTGLWARRTALDVYDRWESLSHEAPFEALTPERQRWWLDTRARCLVVYDASLLVSLAQYHEYLVYRIDDASFECSEATPLQIIEERTVIKLLEKVGVPPLPAHERQDLVERYRYVVQSAPPDFTKHSLRTELSQGEFLSDPWISILTLPRANLTTESAYDMDFMPEINSQGNITLPSTSGFSSTTSTGNHSMDISSSLSLMTANGSGGALQSHPTSANEVAALVASDEFQQALASTKQFFQNVGASPAVSHLLYRLAKTDNAADFAEFCRLYGLS